MRIVRPSWVIHADDKDRKSTMYSLDVHPDGTRLATGGIDRKVKIWNTLPIVDEDAAADEANHKLLCTMSSHTGSVLCVRWAHHGRYLASGSDDFVIMLWGIDTEGGGRVFGSNEVNVESWRPLKRLVGHTADVIDLAWSKDDSMLASVGLDNCCYIWDGQTFDKIRKIDQHTDFVKGVCWDPVGEFLATQSDDKTVKIWNTSDWSLATSVERPFRNSPKSTFFRRLSWSPDGAFIAASNAMNGPAFVASVIERNSNTSYMNEEFGSEISFVGHESTIQVAAFNPRLFFHDPEENKQRGTASCMIALGADDHSISIWINSAFRPIVVIKNLFTNALHDMCWARDGHHLYCCSHDGTIAAFIFEPSEMLNIADLSVTDQILLDYQYEPVRHGKARVVPLQPIPSVSDGFGAPSAAPATGGVNVLQPRKKRDGPPRLVPGARTAPQQTIGTGSSSNPFEPAITADSNSAAQRSRMAMINGAQNAFGSNAEAGPSVRAGQKRKNSDGEYGNDRRFGPVSRLPDNIQQIRAPRQAIASNGVGSGTAGRRLPLPVIQTILRETTKYDGFVSAYNSEGSGRSKIVYTSGRDEDWEDHVEGKVLGLSISGGVCAAGMEDGRLRVYGRGGQRLATFKLDSAIAEMSMKGDMLGVLTSSCLVSVYNVRTNKKIVDERDISRLLEVDGKSVDLSLFAITGKGIPIIITTEPAAFAFDTSSNDWREVSNIDCKLSTAPTLTGERVVALIEQEILQSPAALRIRYDESVHGPREKITLNHLEARVRAAKVLGSGEELRVFAEDYAGVVVAQGMKERAVGLCEMLLGDGFDEDCREALGGVIERLARDAGMKDIARVYRGRL